MNRERGRPAYLHVRVVADIDTCWQRGMDVQTWVKEGLVDVIVPGAGYMLFDMDLDPWLDLVEGQDCWVFPCANRWKRTEVTRAWAKLMYHRGAHGLQLFNYGHMLHGHDRDTPPRSERLGTVWYDDLHPDYYCVLHEIHDPRVLPFLDSAYELDSVPRAPNEDAHSGQNHRVYRGIDAIVLPVVLSEGSHVIPFGIADDLEAARQRGSSPKVTLRLQLDNFAQPDEYDVFVNGRLLPGDARSTRAQFIIENFTRIPYPMPLDVLILRENELEIVVKRLNPAICVTPQLDHVEILVGYA